MIAQLQKLWILSTNYSLIMFRSLHHYRPGLIILTIKRDVILFYFFITSTSKITAVQLRCHNLSDD